MLLYILDITKKHVQFIFDNNWPKKKNSLDL